MTMKTRSRIQKISFTLVTLTISVGAFALIGACNDDSAVHENVPVDSGGSLTDSGAPQDGGTVIITGDSSITVNCFAGDAQTYVEIINACTTATKIDKHPTLPLLQADGGLPPLP
jgi:hypothetical protein